MRYKFIILFLLISFVGKAQVYQLMPQYGYDTKRMNFDSTIQIPTFCGVPKLGSNVTKKGALAFDSCNNRFYYFNPKFQSWDTIKSADATLFVKYTDTASLLLPYLRKADTVSLSSQINERVKYSDTSAMLSPYINSVNYGLIKSGQTISVDTSKISTLYQINLRVKYSDTAAMLSPYLRSIDTTNKFVNSVTKVNDTTIRVGKGSTLTDIVLPHPSSVLSATRLVTTVYNNTGSTILKGSVVYISGRHSSNLPTIALAEANNEANSYKTFALVENDIPTSSSGIVIQAGNIGNLNLPTSTYTDGDILYLSPTVPGGYTTTKPLAPYHICKLGSVTRAHPTFGSIEIKIENGWQLDELSDVSIAAVPADSTLLQFSRVDSLWHDVSPLVAIGNRYIKPSDTASMLTNYAKTNLVNTKLNISDTASMLSPYARTNSVNASLATKLNISDTSSMLSPYLRSNVASATYATISQNNTKLNISDSAAMLSPYLLKIDTVSLSNRINLKQNLITLTTTGTSGAATFNQSTGALNIPQYSGTNIYNSDGSLTGARVLTLNSNPLDFAGTTSTRFFANGNIGIGTTTDVASAQLQVTSTTKGFLQPRLTTTQMNAISTPATGLSVFNTTDSSNYIYRGTGGGWSALVNATGAQTIAGNKTFTGLLTASSASIDGQATSGTSLGVKWMSMSGVGGRYIYNSNTNSDILAINNNILAMQPNGITSFAIGSFSINATGSNNVGILGGGTGAGSNNTTVGSTASQNFTTGSNNTAIGQAALYNVTTNSDNVAIGRYAGTSTGSNSNANHSQSIFIGSGTGWSSGGTALTNTTIIGTNLRTNLSNVFMLGRSDQTIMIGEGTSVASGAALQIDATNKGFMPPRMTTTQRDNITSPAAGLIIYNTTTNKHQGYNGTTWNDFY